MALIMHAARGNTDVYKTLIAAEYVGVEVKMNENFRPGMSNKSPEFLKMNPTGTFPVLETPDGPVFEGNAIARYVARGSPLFGSSLIEYGQIEQWIEFSSSTLDANFRRLLKPRIGYGPQIESAEEVYIYNVKRGLVALNKHLASHSFLVGDSMTLADIITTCNLLLGFWLLLPKSFTCEYPNVERYFWKMIDQPNFSKITGEVKQVDASIPYALANKPRVAEAPMPRALKHPHLRMC
ncbi:elongation factor 1-gamma 2-like [Rutidosis leptorrhynchoides]|uniref:elongation factor 1-gamma 2-like n=1 Tax=Rutidosis leptorrhynchoides TaxID=125765 RepID=UPI003A99FB41